jgi:hypothetical protein
VVIGNFPLPCKRFSNLLLPILASTVTLHDEN